MSANRTRKLGKAAFVGLVMAALSAVLVGSVASAATFNDTTANLHFTVQSEPGVDDAAWRLSQQSHPLDLTNPWTADLMQQSSDGYAFNRARPVDMNEPWTSKPLKRMTPSLRIAGLDRVQP